MAFKKGKKGMDDKKLLDTPTISQQDVVDAIARWRNDNGEETTETVLYFASELTGISVDALLEHL